MDTSTDNDNNKLSQIEELIVNMVRAKPSLYDKSDDRYHQEYKDRLMKFEIISQAIFQCYGILWTGKCMCNKYAC